ncbi:Cytochrome b561/ferric reductase transmembrane domain-containing protein [Fasciolopsis buskii]|uniref:ascorbate ferrireductase (transmembrane) n=1 Tax=Fasciolopsis buskii TaxID=27845 RepID=A0A8E0S041_9TREM|nr:Cytochrome b561/ferric reductase transmembrane domain-containing protein [Fasciolopsis buski]
MTNIFLLLSNHQSSFELSYGVKVHACLMLFAWGFCNPNAMISVRQMKMGWPGRTICNLSYWFLIHLLLQVTLVVFVFLGFMIIIVYVAGYSKFTELPYAAHPPLGFIVFFLTVTEVIVAWFLISSDGVRRSVLRNVHLCIGLICQLFAVALIFIGFQMPGISVNVCTSPVYSGMYLANVLTHVIADVILEVLNYQIMFKTRGRFLVFIFLNFFVFILILALRGQFEADGVNIDQAILRMAESPRVKKKIAMSLLSEKPPEEQVDLKNALMKINLLRNVKYFVYAFHVIISFTLVFLLVIGVAYA